MTTRRSRSIATAFIASLACLVTLPACAQPAPAAATAPDPAVVRSQIDELLRQITAAVGAADQPGYLSHVPKTHPCFPKEQENWALDLGRKAPEHFEVALTDADLTLTDEGAEGRLKWSWRMPGANDRSLSFVARFVRGEGGWLYAGEKWNVLEGDHCKVFYDNGLEDAAKLVAEVLPEVRAHVHEGFELTDDKDLTERTQQIKLYSSMRHLQHSIYLSYSDGLGGWNEPKESVKILPHSSANRTSLRILLAHEYGHVATFQLGPKANDAPWWALEGVADLSSEVYAQDESWNDRMVRGWAETGGLVEWDRLADFHGEATQHMLQVYHQGRHMVSYISTRFGRQGRNRWLRAMARGASLEDATTSELGLSFVRLDQDWRETLKSSKPADEPERK